MVNEQIIPRGIKDQAVLAAMRRIPRHRFVPVYYSAFAYNDGPLPIGHGQTISQPFVVALMSTALALQDAKKVLTGGDNSATQYFQDKTRTPLNGRFLPIVTQVTKKIGLAQQYDGLAAKAQSLGLVKEDASIEHHVTARALDGLYLMIGDEEKKIRSDPAGAGSALLKKVFGAL